MTIANQTGLIGMSTDRASATPEHVLGSVGIAGQTSYQYVSATAAQAAASVFTLSGTATASGTGYTHDVPAPGVPIGQYFWAKKSTSPF